MRRIRLGPVALVAVAVLVVALGSSAAGLGSVQAQAPPASAPIPLGTDGHGIHLVQHGRPQGLVLTFDVTAAARYRLIAGRHIEITCARRSLQPNGTALAARGGEGVSAPRRRRPIATYDTTPWDYCTIDVQHGNRTIEVATIALTAAGAADVDARNTAAAVVHAVHLLDRLQRPSAEQIAARVHGVVLASSAETPPAGTLGLYSDRVAHVYAAKSDQAGTLLFLEEDGDVTRTNLLDYLIDPAVFLP